MTKRVRIENADTSDHKLIVQTWQKGADGAEDVLVTEQELNNPTDITEGMVWQEQYLVIKEAA